MMSRLFVTVCALFVSLASFGQSFSTQSYPVGAGPTQLIVADFNGDHIPDLATVNNASNTVSILINNGDGTFRPQMEFATGPSPISLAAVDWNKDGKMDLVVANNGADAAHSVSVLLGNGDGTFQPHHEIPGAPNANSIAVGDFNHDGNPDIATSSNSPVNAVYVSLGNGRGGIIAQKVTKGFGAVAQPGANPFLVGRIVWADFNRDGKDDLYYVECCGGFDIEFGAWGVLIGNGDGTFTDHLESNEFLQPSDLISVDINQDGLSDLLIPYLCVHDPCEGVIGFINNGDGTFTTVPDFPGIASQDGGDVPGGAAFDINGDGLKDIVAVGDAIDGSNFTNTTLNIAQQNADGSFNSQPVIVPLNAPSPGGLTRPVVADFNHDGKLDIAYIAALPGGILVTPAGGASTVWVVLNTTPSSACLHRTTNHTVTVCHPGDGAVGPSATHIVSHATSSTPVSVSQIYEDFNLVFQVEGGDIDTVLPLAPGNHRLEVKSWSEGKDFRNDFSVSTIASGGGGLPPCTESTDFKVNICSPGEDANVNSPVNVVAATKSSSRITSMQIYVDSELVFHEADTTEVDTDVPMTKGTHFMEVKAWDTSGRHFSSTRTIHVD